MSNHELILTQLQEETAKEIMVQKKVSGFNEVLPCVEKSAEIAKRAREDIEEATGKSIITSNDTLTEQQKLDVQ